MKCILSHIVISPNFPTNVLKRVLLQKSEDLGAEKFSSLTAYKWKNWNSVTLVSGLFSLRSPICTFISKTILPHMSSFYSLGDVFTGMSPSAELELVLGEHAATMASESE